MRLGLVPGLLKGVGLAPCLQLVPGEKRREKVREGLNSASPISSQLLPAGYDRYCRVPLTIIIAKVNTWASADYRPLTFDAISEGQPPEEKERNNIPKKTREELIPSQSFLRWKTLDISDLPMLQGDNSGVPIASPTILFFKAGHPAP
jgi:hypothetical protein